MVWDYLDPSGQAYAVAWLTADSDWATELPNYAW